MRFPVDDAHWVETLDFLRQRLGPLTPLLAPNEFLEFFPGTYHYNVTYVLPPEHFEFVAIHKGMLGAIGPSFARRVLDSFTPVFGNAVFVVCAKHPVDPLPYVSRLHLRPLLRELSAIEAAGSRPARIPACAGIVTTYNRPRSLRRTLPQLLQLEAPLLIVDDASAPEVARENQRIADDHHVPLIHIPHNRGLCNAVNSGLSYWLADPAIDWISSYQDDVDVHPDLLKVLARIQDPETRPILTGRDASEHLTMATGAIAGYSVLYKRSMPGVHLHCHRDYWASVMPIPTPYLGAPKPTGGRPGQGSDEDWWVTAWSPNAIAKRGGYVICVPGLVRTFDVERSTWAKPKPGGAGGSPADGDILHDLAVPRTDQTAAWVPVVRPVLRGGGAAPNGPHPQEIPQRYPP